MDRTKSTNVTVLCCLYLAVPTYIVAMYMHTLIVRHYIMYIYGKLAEWLVVPCTLLVLKYEQYDCTESLLLLAAC